MTPSRLHSQIQTWRALMRKPRLFVVLSAPVALLLALWWLPRVDANARLGVAAGRDEAVVVAQELAREMGLPELADSEAVVVVGRAEESSDRRGRYLRLRTAAAPQAVALAERLVPPVLASVRLSSAAGDQLNAQISPAGRVLGFEVRRAPRRGGPDQEAGEMSVLTAIGGADAGADDPESVALAALRSHLGEELFAQLRLEPVDRQAEKAGAGEEGGGGDDGEVPPETDSLEDESLNGRSTHRVEWVHTSEALPELEVRLSVRLKDGRVTRQEIRAALSDADEAATLTPLERGGGGTALLALAWTTLSIVAFLAFAYGLWRYVERLQESEVSHGRTALLGAGAGLLACLVIYYQIVNAGGREQVGIDIPLPLLLGIAFAVFFFIGLFLGVVWAGCEGDMREVYGDKLVSLDALFSGRFLSANVGRAVLGALAVGAWVMLLRVFMLLPWSAQPGAGPRLVELPFYLLHPWQHAAAKAFAFLLLFAPLCLLAPLSLLRRWTRSRLRTVPVLALLTWLALWINPATALFTLPSVAGMAEAAAWAAGFLVAFLVFDLLTALLSHAAALGWLHLLYFTHQPSPTLLQEAAVGAAVLFGAAVVGGVLRTWGSELTAEEVRPGYARNMLERVALTAELSAARQAQGRMLPQESPVVPGAQLTSCCPPEWESEGDYFDYFPLSDGRMGVAVADFGRAGLAAALRMTLAKGFLLSYSRRLLEPREMVRRVLGRLGELVTGEGDVALAYGVFDPEPCRLTLARGPRSPLVVLLSAQGGEPRLLAGTETQEENSGEAEEIVIELTADDRLIFANVEGVDWAAEKDRARERWLALLRQTRARSADDLLRLVRNKGLTVSTLLVLTAEGSVPRRETSPEDETEAVA